VGSREQPGGLEPLGKKKIKEGYSIFIRRNIQPEMV